MADFVEQVENALNCLFDPSTSNEKKQEIENELQKLKGQKEGEGLVHCYHMLTLSRNQYVLWFACNFLEEIVKYKWENLSDADQSSLLQFLSTRLIESDSLQMPPFLETKLGLTYVLIGKQDYPQKIPDFLSRIQAFVQEPKTCRVGLNLLKLCAEEFVRNDDRTITSKRKVELKQALVAQMPSIMASLTNVLNLTCQVLQNSPDDASISEYDAMSTLALRAIEKFVDWAPVGEYLNRNLVTLIFRFTTHRSVQEINGIHFKMLNSSIAALDCITNLLSIKFVPRQFEFEFFVMEMLNSLIQVLQALTVATPSGVSEMMNHVGEEYLDKMTEFLNVFFDNHLGRLERSSRIALGDFLELLLAYTCRQPHSIGFINCLGMWEHFVTFINESSDSTMNTVYTSSSLESYEGGLNTLMLHLVDRIRYASNSSQLEELDDTIIEAGSKLGNANTFKSDTFWEDLDSKDQDTKVNQEDSDLEQFVNECVDLIVSVADIPSCAKRLLEKCNPLLQGCLKDFFNIHTQPAPATGEKRELYAVRDMATLLRVVSRVSGKYYCITADESQLKSGWEGFLTLMEITRYMSQHRLHARGLHFERLQVESIQAIRSSISCLAIPSRIYPGNCANVISSTTDSIIDTVLVVLDTVVLPGPESTMCSALELLACLCSRVPPEILHNVPNMQKLKAGVHRLSIGLPWGIQGKLYTAISNALLPASLPINSTDWTARQCAYSEFAGQVSNSVCEVVATLQNNPSRREDHQIISQISRDTHILRALAIAVCDSPKPAKVAFQRVVSPCLSPMLGLLTLYMKKQNNSGNDQSFRNSMQVAQHVLSFFSAVLRAIRKEIGPEFIAEIVTNFVELFQQDHIAGGIGMSGDLGVSLLCMFLNLLRTVVSDPTSKLRSFLKGILDLCFGQMKFLIFESQYRHVFIPPFLLLLQEILEQHFSFFVKVNPPGIDGNRQRVFTSDMAYSYFFTMFQALGSILDQEDSPPRIVKLSFSVLERINRAHNLYSLEAFQVSIREHYITSILKLLISGRLNLVQEEACLTIYSIASVNWESFYNSAFPSFIRKELQVESEETISQLTRLFSLTRDFHTFQKNILEFVNDYHVYSRTRLKQ